MTTRAISTSTPRVNLPGIEHVTVPEVREALENYLRIHRERSEAQRRVSAAELAFHNAEGTDRRELAEVIVAGGNVGKVKGGKAQAAEELDRAKGGLEAYGQAVTLAYTRLTEAVDAHRDEWVAQLAERQRAAAVRYERAAAEVAAAGAELNATGELLAMLSESRGLSVRPWRPNARASIAASALAEAVPVVKADVAGLPSVRPEGRKLTPAALVEDELTV